MSLLREMVKQKSFQFPEVTRAVGSVLECTAVPALPWAALESPFQLELVSQFAVRQLQLTWASGAGEKPPAGAWNEGLHGLLEPCSLPRAWGGKGSFPWL